MSQSLTHYSEERVQPGKPDPGEIYRDRRLSEGYPEMDRLALENFSAVLEAHPSGGGRVENLLRYLNRLVDLGGERNILVLGCGPKPETVRILIEKNHKVVGVEPVPSFVRSAREYLASDLAVVEGAAESIPFPDLSQHMVFCDSVLEHVVSPTKSLDEMYRVLAPGGIAFITTTNRYKISLTGDNGEYHYRFFNWLPKLVKECLVFKHLHYDPQLANYSQLPAVHWFTYAELCALGRQAGFARFYSTLDLLDRGDPSVQKSWLKKLLLNRLKFNPWLRALALTQLGGTIIMLKD
ncbi:MAG: class I SAM-dependent methyltransferase [Blastocatellia bacterium]|nr:class I SAM-dependent methyltransferase [Blastocatellia bacterium]